MSPEFSGLTSISKRVENKKRNHLSLGVQMVKNLPAMRDTWVRSLGWEDPVEEEGTVTHSSILSWRIAMHRGAWWAIVRGVAKSWTRLSN